MDDLRKDFTSQICQARNFTDRQHAVASYCAELIRATGDNSPPNRTGRIAQLLGLEAGPRARVQLPLGLLNIETGQIFVRVPAPQHDDCPLNLESERVIIQENSRRSRPLTASERARMRFTYAHELGHALFYDFKVRPTCRLAPTFQKRDEETLCNLAASHLLLPPAWIEPEFAMHDYPTAKLLCDSAKRYMFSLHALTIRAANYFTPRLPPGAFYMLSRRIGCVKGWGEKKPRCLVAFLPNNLRSEGVSFLASYQGLNRIQRLDREGERWSLEDMHDPHWWQPKTTSGPHLETLRCPDGSVVTLESTHSRLGDPATVWTEGHIEIVSGPAKKKRSKCASI